MRLWTYRTLSYHYIVIVCCSDSLREALGLQDSQLPLYIYKMRVMGYPPGWMMEAQTNDAPVLAMFGKDGNGKLHENIKNDIEIQT